MDGSAKFVDCSVRSSVRKNPGLTMVVVMPNGATSGCSDAIQPSRPNFEAALGGTKLKADEASCRGNRNNVPGALLAHDRQDSAGDVHRANEARRQLPLHLLWRQLLEVTGIKAGSIV